MTRRIKIELAVSVFFVALSVFVIAVVSGYEDPMQEQYKTLRSSFVPTLWASMLGLLALIHGLSQILQSTGVLKNADEELPGAEGEACQAPQAAASPEDRKKITVMVIVTAAAMILYCLLLFEINFILNTFWLLALTLYTYGERQPLKLGIVSVLGSVGLWLLFEKLMEVPL